MNQRRQVTLVAAAATLLATAPLSTIYATWTWAVDSLLTVGVVCLAALGVRSLRAPVWAQALAMLGGLAVILTLLFGGSGSILGLIPTGTTLRHFGQLLGDAGKDIHDEGIPVPDRPGLLFLTAMSVGLAGIVTDLVAVVLRRPGLAGFPMLAMYWIPVLVHQDSVSFIPFVVAAIGFLWLLVTDNVDRVRRFGRRFTGEGRDVDLWEPSPLAAAGRRLAVVGVLLAVLLPLAIPGMTSGLLDNMAGGGNGTGSGTGSGRGGSTVSLFAALQGDLNQTKQFDMVKVTTTDPNPYYLRFGVAENLTDQGFTPYVPNGGQPAVTDLPNVAPSGPGVTAHTYQASVDILNFDMSILPVYTQVTKLQKLDSSWFYDRNANIIYSNRSNTKGKKYTFDYVHSDFTPAALRTSWTLASDDPIQRRDTALPSTPSQVTTTVNRLISGKTTQYDKVRAIYDYFSQANNFRYALSTKSGTTGSDIADFLTNRQGYCVQYAAAMAWLVRAAGIPARVAFGFTRGGAHEGNSYTLTNFNLHAWTEVYFTGFGWVPFDATPTAGIAGSVSPAWAPDVNHNDTVTTPGLGSATNPNGGQSGGPAAGGKDPTKGEEGGSSTGAGKHQAKALTWPWLLLGGGALLLVLLAAPAARRATVRRGRRPRAPAGATATELAAGEAAGLDAPPGEMRVVVSATGNAELVRQDAHGAWDEFIDTLVDHRIPVDDAETPRALVDRVTGALRLPEAASAGVQLLGRAEERARYARLPLAARGLAEALAAVRTAIAERASQRTRLRAILLPPSVLQRWRATMNERTGTLAGQLSRGQEAVARALSPRRLLPGRR